MASLVMRVSFRITMVILVLFVLFYVGRPLYWKISATIHNIRQNKRTVKQDYKGEGDGRRVRMSADHALLKPTFKLEHVTVMAEGSESSDGVMYSDEAGKLVRVLSSVNLRVLRESFSRRLGDRAQSAAARELP